MGKDSNKNAVETKKVNKKQVADSDSSDDSSSEEEVKPVKPVTPKVTPKQPTKKAESSSDSDSDSSSDDAKVKAVKTPVNAKTPVSAAKKVVVSKPVKKESSSSDSSDSDAKPVQKVSAKGATPVQKQAAKATPKSSKKQSSSSDSSDSDEETAKPAAKKSAVTPVQQKAVVKPASSSSDSESEDELPKAKIVPKVVAAAAVKSNTKVPAKKVSSSDDSSDSDDEPAKPVAKPAAVQKNAKSTPAAVQKVAKKDTSSSDSSSDSDDAPAKPVTKQPAPAAQQSAKSTPTAAKKSGKPAKKDSSSSDSSDEESAPAKPNGKAVVQPKVATKKKESSSSESDSSSEDEKPKQKPAVAKVNEAKPKQKKADSSSSSSSDDDSEEESKPVKVAAAKPAKKAESSSSEESDSEDDGGSKITNGKKPAQQEMDVDEDEDEENKQMAGVKRKAQGEVQSAAKKTKVDETQGGNELFIKGITSGVTEDILEKFFKKSGIEVESINLFAAKGFCFLVLADPSDASSAVELSGSELKGGTLQIEVARPRGQKGGQDFKGAKSPGYGASGGFQQQGGDERDRRTVFVKNVPYSASQENIGELFESVTQVRLPLNEEGQPKGFAFVEFESVAAAEAVLNNTDGFELNGRQLFVDKVGGGSKGAARTPNSNNRQSGGQGNFQSGPTRTLIVKNLAFSTDADRLQEVFENSTEARVPTFPDSGKPRGIAFINFNTVEEAESAMKTMSGKTIDGRQVTIDFAESRDSGSRGGGRGGFRGGRGGGDRGGRGGFDRGGFRGGRGGRGGGRGGFSEAQQRNKGILVEATGKRTTFNNDDSD